MTNPSLLLEAVGLTKRFPVTRGILLARQTGAVHAVTDVTLGVAAGHTLGIVGESGSGKSTTGRMLCRLLDPTEGTVRLDGSDITSLDGEELRVLRRRMQFVFQDPAGALNPRHTVGQSVAAPLRVQHVPGNRRARVDELLDAVGLGPEQAGRYPHELSGGQRQRVGIARALALDPDVLVLDEPVSALDVSVQAHILNLLIEIQQRRGMAYVVISHDLGVIRQLSDEVAVMYLGRIVERAPASVITTPAHPYTAALIAAAPGRPGGGHRPRVLLQGDPPSPISPPSGCAFHPRCPKARLISGNPDRVPDACRTERPPLTAARGGHAVACWYPLAPGDGLATSLA